MPVLTDLKRERFCHLMAEYVAYKRLYPNRDYNERRAMIEAGYTESVAKQRCRSMMRNEEINARVTELLATIRSDAILTREECLQRLTNIARGDIADHIECLPDGTIKAKVSRRGMASKTIKRVRARRKTVSTAEGEVVDDVHTEIDLYDPMTAMSIIADIEGWKQAPEGSNIVIQPTTIIFARDSRDAEEHAMKNAEAADAARNEEVGQPAHVRALPPANTIDVEGDDADETRARPDMKSNPLFGGVV